MSKGIIGYETLTDLRLLELVKDRDRAAFDAIYLRYHSVMYLFALKIMKNGEDASDIVQEVFVKFWEKAPGLSDGINVKSYLYAAVRNRVLNFIRDNRTRLANNYTVMLQSDGKDENGAFRFESEECLGKCLVKAIDGLPKQQKMVALARKEGYSNREIADKMNLSLNTVNVHYKLCIKALRKKFNI